MALVDDYDVVLRGVAHMFEQYRDRIIVAELDSNESVDDVVDIVLYDSFAQPESDQVRPTARAWVCFGGIGSTLAACRVDGR